MFVIHNHVVLIFVLINEHVLLIHQDPLMFEELEMDNVSLYQIVVNFVSLKVKDFHQEIVKQLLMSKNVGILVNEDEHESKENSISVFLRLLYVCV
jgi:hypothetical protein